jgi:hypothetical protein
VCQPDDGPLSALPAPPDAPGLQGPIRPHPEPSGPSLVRVAQAGEADGRGVGGDARLDVSGVATVVPSGRARSAGGRPHKGSGYRWRGPAAAAGRALPVVQRPQGSEPASALSLGRDQIRSLPLDVRAVAPARGRVSRFLAGFPC